MTGSEDDSTPEAVSYTHLDVYKRQEQFGLGDALDAIGAFAHNDHVGLGLEQGAQPEAHNEMIVDDQDPDLVHALIPQPARSPSLACPAGAESRS